MQSSGASFFLCRRTPRKRDNAQYENLALNG
jgi:hypothetical protein